MSEVAVKIYEQKRDIQRFQLAHVVNGKAGASQSVILVNADTDAPVDRIVLQRAGRYQVIEIMLGTKIQSVQIDCKEQGVRQPVERKELANTESAYYKTVLMFGSKMNQVWDFRLTHLQPDSIVTECYLTYTFLDD